MKLFKHSFTSGTMKPQVICSHLFVSLALAGTTASAQEPTRTFASEALSSIVQVRNGNSLGSGVWVGKDLVATCLHVVAGPPGSPVVISFAAPSLIDLKLSTVVEANWDQYPSRVVATDPANDIALVRTDRPMSIDRIMGINGQVLVAHPKWAVLDEVPPDVLKKVFLAGFPLGKPYGIVQGGTMAALTGDLEIQGLPGRGKLLLSLVANHGNSGGPIYNEDGAVIGLLEGALPSVPTATDSALAVSGLAVAIPIIFVERLIEKWKSAPESGK